MKNTQMSNIANRGLVVPTLAITNKDGKTVFSWNYNPLTGKKEETLEDKTHVLVLK